MAFTEDGQINQDLVMQRDLMYGVTREEIIENRRDLEIPLILPGADSWKQGKATVLDVKEIDLDTPLKKKIS